MPAKSLLVVGVVAAGSMAAAVYSIVATGQQHTARPAPRASGNAETDGAFGGGGGGGERGLAGGGSGGAAAGAGEGAGSEAGSEPKAGSMAVSFPTISGPADTEQNLSDLERKTALETQGVTELSAMGATATERFGNAAARALAPYLLGSRERMLETVRALGGTVPEVSANAQSGGSVVPGATSPLFALLKGASLDYSRARIVPKMIDGARRETDEMSRMINDGAAKTASGKPIPGTSGVESAGGARSAGRGRGDETVIRTMVGGLYPDVQDPASKRLSVFEVRVPMLLEGADPKTTRAEIGVELAWEPVKKQWQPVGMQIYNMDQAAAMRFAKAAQEARAAQQQREAEKDPAKAAK